MKNIFSSSRFSFAVIVLLAISSGAAHADGTLPLPLGGDAEGFLGARFALAPATLTDYIYTVWNFDSRKIFFNPTYLRDPCEGPSIFDAPLSITSQLNTLYITPQTGNTWSMYSSFSNGTIDVTNLTLATPPTAPPEVEYNGVQTVAGDLGTINIFAGSDIYAATNNAVYVQHTPNGAWNVDTTGFNGAMPLMMTTDSASNVYVASRRGLLTQTSQETTWTAMTLPSQMTGVFGLFVDRRDRIFISDKQGNIFFTTDRGTTWTSTTISNFGFSPLHFTDDPHGTVYAFAVAGYPTSQKVFKLAAASQTWSDISAPLNAWLVNPAMLNSMYCDSLLFAATSFGVMQSGDQGASWSKSNKDLDAQQIYGFAKNAAGKHLASTDLGIFRDSGRRGWMKMFPVNGFLSQLPITQSRNGNLYTFTDSAVTRSTDGGETWKQDDTTGFAEILDKQFIYVDEAGTQYTVGQGTVWHKKSGAGWEADTTGLPQNYYAYKIFSDGHGTLYMSSTLGTIREFLRALNGTTWLPDTAGLGGNYAHDFAVDRNGKVFAAAGYYVYGRAGEGWQAIPFPNDVAAGSTNEPILLSTDSNNILFASFDPFGVYYTSDEGAHWYPTILNSVHIPSQQYIFTTGLCSYGDTTFATTRFTGIYELTAIKSAALRTGARRFTFDTTKTNVERDSSITITSTGNDTLLISAVASSNPRFNATTTLSTPIAPGAKQTMTVTFKPLQPGRDSTKIFISSNAMRSVDTIRIFGNAIQGSDVTEIIPTSQLLLQHYPNPAATYIDVTFQVGAASRATLQLLDVMGRVVNAIEERNLLQSPHSARFETSALPSGTYYLQLRAGMFSVTKPVIVLGGR